MNWLLRDEQMEVFDALLACVAGLLFLGFSALVLWPVGKTRMVLRFAEGQGLFWLVLGATTVLLIFCRRVFRVDMYSRFNAYVISALVVTCFWQTCWSAFAALTVHSFSGGASFWLSAVLYFIGLLSCYVAFLDVSALYRGHIYKLINAPVALLSFVLFSVWPGAGTWMFGWLLNWF